MKVLRCVDYIFFVSMLAIVIPKNGRRIQWSARIVTASLQPVLICFENFFKKERLGLVEASAKKTRIDGRAQNQRKV